MDAFASNEVQVKRFADLSEQEILALAITNEEEDSRIYRGFAEGLREQFPASAKVFDEMADEEVRHRTMLFDLYRTKFGEYLPLIRRQDVKGFIQNKPLWLVRPLRLEEVRKYAEAMEFEAARYYRKAALSARDASIRHCCSSLPRSRTSTKTSRKSSGSKSSPRRPAPAKTRRPGAYSCCSTCSPGWPA
jgi:rubrerythrin